MAFYVYTMLLSNKQFLLKEFLTMTMLTILTIQIGQHQNFFSKKKKKQNRNLHFRAIHLMMMNFFFLHILTADNFFFSLFVIILNLEFHFFFFGVQMIFHQFHWNVNVNLWIEKIFFFTDCSPKKKWIEMKWNVKFQQFDFFFIDREKKIESW